MFRWEGRDPVSLLPTTNSTLTSLTHHPPTYYTQWVRAMRPNSGRLLTIPSQPVPHPDPLRRSTFLHVASTSPNRFHPTGFFGGNDQEQVSSIDVAAVKPRSQELAADTT